MDTQFQWRNESSASIREVLLNASEMSRAIVGQLGWLANQGRSDLAASVSKLQQSLTIAARVTLQELNQTLRMAKEPWIEQVVGLGYTLDEIIALVATDGAHAVMPGG